MAQPNTSRQQTGNNKSTMREQGGIHYIGLFITNCRLNKLPYNIGIKHGFSCINIRQFPWEVLTTEAEGRGCQHLPRNLANVNALKTHVRSLLLHKNWKYLRYFLHYFVSLFHWCLANAISTDYVVLGLGSTHLVTAANAWPWYDHIESCIDVH